MRSINLFIAKIVSRLFPHFRVINFRTTDNISTCAYGIVGNGLTFSVLKNPLQADPKYKITKNDIKYKGAWVKINFFTPESIDNLIEKLQEIKQNMILQQAAEILDKGGEMAFTKTYQHEVNKARLKCQKIIPITSPKPKNKDNEY